MSWFVVDVEADDQVPMKGSMVCFGAVVMRDLNETFYGQTKPIVDTYNPEALKVSGFTREEHEKFDDPIEVMVAFKDWVNKVNGKYRPIFVSDNPGFDFSWINFYFLNYLGENPFGWSSRRIGDLWCGYKNNPFYKWKGHRKTKHSHNPVDDAIGNAEALLKLKEIGFKINFR